MAKFNPGEFMRQVQAEARKVVRLHGVDGEEARHGIPSGAESCEGVCALDSVDLLDAL